MYKYIYENVHIAAKYIKTNGTFSIYKLGFESDNSEYNNECKLTFAYCRDSPRS